MGFNGFSESTLRDYLVAVIETDEEISEECIKVIPKVAREVNQLKLRRRRSSDLVTHEMLLAHCLWKFYEYGKTQGVKVVLRELGKSISNIREDEDD